MGKYIIATIKSWNIDNYYKLSERFIYDEFRLVTDKEELTQDLLTTFQPDYIFFPHWSWLIPPSIYDRYECVVFHMTDLPFGRGGSPLQNLLVRGIYDTKVSAIKVTKGMDTGPIYCKEHINISEGNADEIFTRVSDIVFNKMIPRFLNNELTVVEQEGEVVEFKRRTPEQSEIPDGLSRRQLYDYIRMLDGEGYPPAFRRMGMGNVTFHNARLIDDKVYADAVFRED